MSKDFLFYFFENSKFVTYFMLLTLCKSSELKNRLQIVVRNWNDFSCNNWIFCF